MSRSRINSRYCTHGENINEPCGECWEEEQEYGVETVLKEMEAYLAPLKSSRAQRLNRKVKKLRSEAEYELECSRESSSFS